MEIAMQLKIQSVAICV